MPGTAGIRAPAAARPGVKTREYASTPASRARAASKLSSPAPRRPRAHEPDRGRIVIDDAEVRIESPKHALRRGIGMVHQHFMLVGPLTVTENVILGMKQPGFGLDLRHHAAKLAELSDSFGFEIDPHELVWKLPMGMQQRVEILKLLYHHADILIFDEPTSVLAPSETGPFFEVLRRLAEAEKTVLFITHKLDEVMTVADRVTIMRDGKVAAERETRQTGAPELARLMVGRDVMFNIEHREMQAGPEMLDVDRVRAYGNRGVIALDGVSFTVRGGEILGIAGVDGNGQTELAEVIVGLRELDAGQIRIGGRNVEGASVSERKRRFKLGYVPEDRQGVGLVLDHGVAFNMMLRSFRWPPFAQHHILDASAIRANAEKLVRSYDVRLQSVDQETRHLSGGNQQKVILARELEDALRVLRLTAYQGLDVGAIEFVQNTLLDQRGKGVAILYISTELEHLLAVSDRIAVIFRGRITGMLDIEEATPERLGLLMAGAGVTAH